ncbi:hypothetical protein TSAR_008092, partial [Trichomalopsis sarcophagae]
WKKIREKLDSVDAILSVATNIHKSVKNDVATVIRLIKRLEDTQVAQNKSKESLGLMQSQIETPLRLQLIDKKDKAMHAVRTSI